MAAGARCVVTVVSYTGAEDFSEAVLVVSSLGDLGEPARSSPIEAPPNPGRYITLDDLQACLQVPRPGRSHERRRLRDAEQLVRTIADTAVENEKYFCDLDAVVGDGDFGYSLARGFGKVVDDWDAMEYERLRSAQEDGARAVGSCRRSIGSDLGHRSCAGTALKDSPDPSAEDAVAALRAAIEGIKQRGESDLGDKTLLDAP